jgi:hypothetical protein
LQLASYPLPGLTVTAPTVLDGRIFVGTFTGQLVAFASARAVPARAGPAAPEAPGHSSWLDAKHGWVSRETGVFATDDGGRTWSRIYAQPATTVVRTSRAAGVIRIATVAPGCACAYNLWTTDGGKHWTATRAFGGELIGRGRTLYWLADGGLEIRQVLPWPPGRQIRSQTVASVQEGRFVSLALVPGGVAGLAKGPTGGPSIVVAKGGGKNEVLELPQPPGELISQSLRASGQTLIVDGTVFSDGETARVRWISSGDVDGWQPLPS